MDKDSMTQLVMTVDEQSYFRSQLELRRPELPVRLIGERLAFYYEHGEFEVTDEYPFRLAIACAAVAHDLASQDEWERAAVWFMRSSDLHFLHVRAYQRRAEHVRSGSPTPVSRMHKKGTPPAKLLPPPVSKHLRFEILARDGFRCTYCGRQASDTVQLEVDHVTPRAEGGETKPENLVTACHDCNNGKRDRVLTVAPPAGIDS